MTATAFRYATTPCRSCGTDIFILQVAGGIKVAFDPRVRVFLRERDGEGGAVWAPWSDTSVLAEHMCRANRGEGTN